MEQTEMPRTHLGPHQATENDKLNKKKEKDIPLLQKMQKINKKPPTMSECRLITTLSTFTQHHGVIFDSDFKLELHSLLIYT